MIRNYTQSDYSLLCGWWAKQRFHAPTEMILSGTGYISNEHAAGFLYLTNSAISWMEWVVADPSAEKKARGDSVNEVIEHICAQAKSLGSLAVFTSSNSFPFCERLRRLNFAEGDKKVNHFVRSL